MATENRPYIGIEFVLLQKAKQLSPAVMSTNHELSCVYIYTELPRYMWLIHWATVDTTLSGCT
jgi:hypothetical protein